MFTGVDPPENHVPEEIGECIREFAERLIKLESTLSTAEPSPDLNRQVLRWASAAFTYPIMGLQRRIPSGNIFNIRSDINDEAFNDAQARLAQARDNLRGSNGALTGITLGAVHFRGPWLDDGRSTLATARRARENEDAPWYLDQTDPQWQKAVGPIPDSDAGAHAFHGQLLQDYYALYGRPFTFNELVFIKAAQWRGESQDEAPTTVLIVRFEARGGPVYQGPDDADAGAIRKHEIWFPRELLETLTIGKDEDLRLQIYEATAALVGSNAGDRPKNTRAKLSQMGILDELEEAVDSAWHREAADPSSFERWAALMTTLFSRPIEGEAWSKESRGVLRDTLRFMQGIALYEPFAPGGLATIVTGGLEPAEMATIGGLTLGVGDSELLNPTLDALIPKVPVCLENILKGCLHKYERQKPKECRLSGLPGNLDKKVTEKFKQAFLVTPEDESVFAETLEMCWHVRRAVHEQRPQQFQVLLGEADDIGHFRELHVFSREEAAEFEDLDPPALKSQLLLSHYSHLQGFGVSLFIESQKRSHPRVVQVPHHLRSYRDDRASGVSATHHEIARSVTKEIPGLFLIRAGLGKVTVYRDGKVVLLWPNREQKWALPEDEDTLLFNEQLREILKGVLVKLGKSEGEGASHTDLPLKRVVELLAEAIVWVSEQPGMGCNLVLIRNRDELSSCMVSLNPMKWGWVKAVATQLWQPDLLRNILVQDGSTVYAVDSGDIEGQYLIVPVRGGAAVGSAADPGKGAPIDRDRLTWGTRHASACDLTAAIPNSYAITVSSDGPISVFADGQLMKIEELLKKLNHGLVSGS